MKYSFLKKKIDVIIKSITLRFKTKFPAIKLKINNENKEFMIKYLFKIFVENKIIYNYTKYYLIFFNNYLIEEK